MTNGTQVSLEDIFNPNIEANINLDKEDVINYVKALHYGRERLKNYPLTGNFLKEVHKILLTSTRGERKTPGEFRKTQNWIGRPGCNLNAARYVPPKVDDMLSAISDLEKYINNSNDNLLIKIALAHYQFETIHPFLDGNGRIGRMLIIFMLLDSGLLKEPILYVSYYLKLNRIEYYDRLESTRLTGNYEQWIIFMLKAIKEAAKDLISTINETIILKNKCDIMVLNQGESFSKVYNYIYENPILDIKKTSEKLGMSYNTTKKKIETLVDLGILKNDSGLKRNKVYVFEEYLALLKKDTESL